jgi:hypothetical protein
MCVWGRDGTSWFAQLRLLLWKNWQLKKRRPGATCCELLFPVGAVLILLMIRALVSISDVDIQVPVQDKAMVRSEKIDEQADAEYGSVGALESSLTVRCLLLSFVVPH